MSECLTCDDQVPAGPEMSLLPPKVNPDVGTPIPGKAPDCEDPVNNPLVCHNGYRLPVSSAASTAPAACAQFDIPTPCADWWAYAGLLIQVGSLGHVEVVSVAETTVTVKNLTLAEGVSIPQRTQLRPVPMPPASHGIFSVAAEDVVDPAEAESGILSSDVRIPVGVPVQACGASAQATRIGLQYRKGMCGLPLTTAADQSQFMLAAYNPLTKCFHFFPNGDEGDTLVIKNGKPSWQNTTETKYIFDYTGQQQSFTVPEGFTQARLKIWGAGGSQDGGIVGGAGGYTEALINVTPGDIWAIIVGEGVDNKSSRTFGFGGAGQGVAHQHNGGGLSGVFTTGDPVLSSEYARAIAIAGGGGAGGQSGGGGNANSGGPGNGAGSGGQSTMQGIDGTGSQYSGGGGGGGGYRGGGHKGLGGYGGSGFVVGTAVSSSILSVTAGQADPPNTSDVDYTSGIGRSGQPGRVVIEMIE